MINLIRFKALAYREILRFLKVINQTILSPVVSSFLYLSVFGVILGNHVEKIGTVPYISFIIPGIVVMEIIMAAYSNASSSLFLSRYLHLIDSMLVTPVTYTELVLSYIVAGIFRGFIVGICIWLVSLFFAPFQLAHAFMFVFMIIGIGTIFSGAGLLVALWSEEFEDLSIVTTYLITPLIFLGGTFYSIKMLPPLLYKLTIYNPFFYLIDAFRWSITGYSEGSLSISLLLTLGLAVFFAGLNIYLFKSGYKLKQ